MKLPHVHKAHKGCVDMQFCVTSMVVENHKWKVESRGICFPERRGIHGDTGR